MRGELRLLMETYTDDYSTERLLQKARECAELRSVYRRWLAT
jgi:hypothetical protein